MAMNMLVRMSYTMPVRVKSTKLAMMVENTWLLGLPSTLLVLANLAMLNYEALTKLVVVNMELHARMYSTLPLREESTLLLRLTFNRIVVVLAILARAHTKHLEVFCPRIAQAC